MFEYRKNDYVIQNFRNFYISAIYNAPVNINPFYDPYKDDKGRKTEEIVPMDIKELKPYAEQPFKVLLDSSMDEL